MSSLESAIKVSAALRGEGKYREAVDLIEKALQAAAPDDFMRLNANREGLKAAEAAGMTAKAQRFSDAISKPESEPEEEE